MESPRDILTYVLMRVSSIERRLSDDAAAAHTEVLTCHRELSIRADKPKPLSLDCWQAMSADEAIVLKFHLNYLYVYWLANTRVLSLNYSQAQTDDKAKVLKVQRTCWHFWRWAKRIEVSTADTSSSPTIEQCWNASINADTSPKLIDILQDLDLFIFIDFHWFYMMFIDFTWFSLILHDFHWD